MQIRDKIQKVWEQHNASKGFHDKLRGVVENQRPIKEDSDAPLVIFGERFETVAELAHQDHRGAAEFLCAAVNGLDQINRENPDLNLGYAIRTSTGQIIDQLKDESFHDRARAVVLSSDCSGSPVLFVRLLRESFASELPVLLSCESVLDLSAAHRAGLEKLAVPILERPELREAELVELLANTIAAPAELESDLERIAGLDGPRRRRVKR